MITLFNATFRLDNGDRINVRAGDILEILKELPNLPFAQIASVSLGASYTYADGTAGRQSLPAYTIYAADANATNALVLTVIIYRMMADLLLQLDQCGVIE